MTTMSGTSVAGNPKTARGRETRGAETLQPFLSFLVFLPSFLFSLHCILQLVFARNRARRTRPRPVPAGTATVRPSTPIARAIPSSGDPPAPAAAAAGATGGAPPGPAAPCDPARPGVGEPGPRTAVPLAPPPLKKLDGERLLSAPPPPPPRAEPPLPAGVASRALARGSFSSITSPSIMTFPITGSGLGRARRKCLDAGRCNHFPVESDAAGPMATRGDDGSEAQSGGSRRDRRGGGEGAGEDRYAGRGGVFESLADDGRGGPARCASLPRRTGTVVREATGAQAM